MKHLIHLFTFSACLLLASACGIKGHNEAKLIPVNAVDERIYGTPGGPPKQTLNKYEDDKTGKTQERVANLRQKLFPQ
jgi:hypothetical protein